MYSGLENLLVKESAYCLDFTCYYDLTWYPFDTQHCTINISLLAQGQVNIVMSLISKQKQNKGLKMENFDIEVERTGLVQNCVISKGKEQSES